jgi:hypothetical protein
MITSLSNTQFLVIYIGDNMSWKHYIEQVSPKLNAVCYIIRMMKLYTSINTLEMVHYYYFNSIMYYSLPFWSNSPKCINIHKIQKNIIRIMLDYRRRDSGRNSVAFSPQANYTD